jgi:hypothetical protein
LFDLALCHYAEGEREEIHRRDEGTRPELREITLVEVFFVEENVWIIEASTTSMPKPRANHEFFESSTPAAAPQHPSEQARHIESGPHAFRISIPAPP